MNRISSHCVAGAKLSIESDFVEKPAVGMVVRACANAWNGDIASSTPVAPSASRSPNRTAVSAM
jgi:hypothetical protein